MLQTTFEAVAPALQAVTENVSSSFIPSMSSLRESCSYGVEKGISNLAQIGVVIGGIVVIGATTYGVYKAAEWMSDKGANAAHNMRDKAASWVTPKEGTVPDAEVVPPTAAAA